MESQKKRVISELGSVSDEILSLGTTLAMGLLIAAPCIMAVMAMFKRSIDFTMNVYMPMIKHLVFPAACAIILVVYILYFIRLKTSGENVAKILCRNPLFVIFAVASLFMFSSQIYNGLTYVMSGFCAASLGETFGMEIGYFIFILFGATQVKAESHKRFLIRAQVIISVVLVLAAFILWHTQVESTFFSDWDPRFSSIFSNLNYYGYYLAISVPLAGAAYVYEKKLIWKAVALASFVSNTVALSLDDTMGAWVAGILGVIFIIVTHFIIEKKVNWQTLILIPIFALSLYVPGHINGTFESNFSSLFGDMANIVSGDEQAADAGSGRGRIWKASLDIIWENKLVGIGFEGVKYKGYIGAPYNIRPHNEFIQYGMFHGIPMVILYIAGCLGVFIRALKKRKNMDGATLACLAAAFGYLVSSFFGLTIFATGYFLFVFLGMGYVSDTKESLAKFDYKKQRKTNYIILALVIISMIGALIFAAAKEGTDPDAPTLDRQIITEDQPAGPVVVGNDKPEFETFVIDNITYGIDGDHAVLTDFSDFENNADSVVIPETVEYGGNRYPVTVIYDEAFENMDGLKTITLPVGLKEIGANAFDACESLVEMVIPEGVVTVGNDAFNGCSSLKKVVLPESALDLGTDIFYDCAALKTINIPQNLTAIPSGIFSGCIALSEVQLPAGVTSIGSEAFRECEAIKEIDLPAGLKVIGDHAFFGCTSLKSVNIPETVESVGESVFGYCDGLKTVYVPEGKLKEYKEIFGDEDFKVKSY